MSSIYIATGYRNRDAYARAREAAAKLGLTVTFDWTIHEPPPTHQRMDRTTWIQWAAGAERDGVRAADIVLVMLPGGLGTHAELGMALALGKAVVVYAPRATLLEELNGDPCCVFYSLADFLTSSWSEVEAFLTGYTDTEAGAVDRSAHDFIGGER